MNKNRRKAIRDEILNLKVALTRDDEEKIQNELLEIYSNVEFIYDQEEYYMENMPENMQGGSKYEKAEEACDNLREAMEYIYDASYSVSDEINLITNVNKAIEYLLNATV